MMVRNELGFPSTDLGTLCLCPKVNIFSWHKPKDYNNPIMPDSARESMPGLRYDSVNKQIVWDKPVNYFRLGDFREYDHDAKAPSIDIYNQVVVYTPGGTTLDVGGTPYWGDSRFNWGTILGGFTFSSMKVKIEVYDKNKTLRSSGIFTVNELGQTGHWLVVVSKIGIGSSDEYLYIKGYFCDYNGNVLAPIPTTTDGFVRKKIVYNQMIFYYIKSVSASGGKITSVELDLGDGGESSAGMLYFYNNSVNNYATGKYYPKLVVTVTNRVTGVTTTSTQYDSPNNAPGPYMTRTWSWEHVEMPGGTQTGTYDVDVVASLEYRP